MVEWVRSEFDMSRVYDDDLPDLLSTDDVFPCDPPCTLLGQQTAQQTVPQETAPQQTLLDQQTAQQTVSQETDWFMDCDAATYCRIAVDDDGAAPDVPLWTWGRRYVQDAYDRRSHEAMFKNATFNRWTDKGRWEMIEATWTGHNLGREGDSTYVHSTWCWKLRFVRNRNGQTDIHQNQAHVSFFNALRLMGERMLTFEEREKMEKRLFEIYYDTRNTKILVDLRSLCAIFGGHDSQIQQKAEECRLYMDGINADATRLGISGYVLRKGSDGNTGWYGSGDIKKPPKTSVWYTMFTMSGKQTW
jgi:hypothetical protein